MSRRTRMVLGGVAAAVAIAMVLAAVGPAPLGIALADPPEGQTYTGSKRCASCHFEQYMTWKKTKHATAYEELPAKYQTDATCLKCHTTGYGTPTGFKDIASTPALAGNTCEVCHGPGSEHDAISQKYAKIKTLTPEQDKEVRGSIWLIQPGNVCIQCHTVQAHKKSETPPELRK